MHILVNDEETPIDSGETLDTLLARLTSGGKLAVAVNDTVIRQSEWSGYQLQENDRVLLIAPVQGG